MYNVIYKIFETLIKNSHIFCKYFKNNREVYFLILNYDIIDHKFFY